MNITMINIFLGFLHNYKLLNKCENYGQKEKI